MPLLSNNFELLSNSLLSIGVFKNSHVSGLKYYNVKSGKRNITKHEWRGYIPSGAIKSELNKDGTEYVGLPVPEGIIKCWEKNKLSYINHGTSCYAIGFSDFKITNLIVALPLKNSKNKKEKILGLNDLNESIIDYSIYKTNPYSLNIEKLYIWPFSVNYYKYNRHNRGGFLKTSGFIKQEIIDYQAQTHNIKLDLENQDLASNSIPSLGLSGPYYSLFYDDEGLLLYFIIFSSDCLITF